MGSPLVEHVASLLSATVSPGWPPLFAASVGYPGGVFWIVGMVVLVIAGLRACGLALHRQQPGRDRRETLVGEGFGARGADHRSRWRGGVSGGGAPRRLAFRALALAVPHPQGAAGRRCRKARSATSMPATARRCCRARRWARSIACNNFQDARRFLGGEPTSPEHEPILGQRGRQRAILREGVYAINIALFTVMTEDTVYRLEAGGAKELKALVNWQNELSQNEGFNPVIIGGPIEAPDPLNPDKKIDGRQHRDRDGARRSVAAARRDHRAGGRRRPQRQGLPQQLPGPRGVPPRRRPPRLAVRSADRRHLLHQPLVRHRSSRSPRRSCRSATWAWWSATTAGAATTSRARRSATASGSPKASGASRRSRSGRASMPSTPTPATSSWCRRPTSSCTG